MVENKNMMTTMRMIDNEDDNDDDDEHVGQSQSWSLLLDQEDKDESRHRGSCIRQLDDRVREEARQEPDFGEEIEDPLVAEAMVMIDERNPISRANDLWFHLDS
ncbi:hypothetical protein QYF36_015188 [Acer negundo]|nr:hypothetical protein QYF36_015188 [Acer negundo]